MIKKNLIDKLAQELSQTHEELQNLLTPETEPTRYQVDEKNDLVYRDLSDIRFTATKLKGIADRISKLNHYDEKKGF